MEESIRKLYVTANHIISNTKAEEKKQYQQISMFDLNDQIGGHKA